MSVIFFSCVFLFFLLFSTKCRFGLFDDDLSGGLAEVHVKDEIDERIETNGRDQHRVHHGRQEGKVRIGHATLHHVQDGVGNNGAVVAQHVEQRLHEQHAVEEGARATHALRALIDGRARIRTPHALYSPHLVIQLTAVDHVYAHDEQEHEGRAQVDRGHHVEVVMPLGVHLEHDRKSTC